MSEVDTSSNGQLGPHARADVMHDLRHHLHVLEVGLELLNRDGISVEQRTETIQLLKRECEQARVSIETLFAASGDSSPAQ